MCSCTLEIPTVVMAKNLGVLADYADTFGTHAIPVFSVNMHRCCYKESGLLAESNGKEKVNTGDKLGEMMIISYHIIL